MRGARFDALVLGGRGVAVGATFAVCGSGFAGRRSVRRSVRRGGRRGGIDWRCVRFGARVLRVLAFSILADGTLVCGTRAFNFLAFGALAFSTLLVGTRDTRTRDITALAIGTRAGRVSRVLALLLRINSRAIVVAAIVGLVEAATFEDHRAADADLALEFFLAALGTDFQAIGFDRLKLVELMSAGVADVLVGGHRVGGWE